jgi:ectoine hydroxylase-related dioxygenase (phytanoyl-CoA dioxygenase family)
LKKKILDHTILNRLWLQTRHNGRQTATPEEWNEQLNAIYSCGKGLEETLRFLFRQKPSLENFIEWMKTEERPGTTDEFIEDTLSVYDIQFFKENGFIVISNALSNEQCENAREAILEFIGADIHDTTTWYTTHEEMRGLMLMCYYHPSLEVIRNSRKIRRAFEQLYATKNIHEIIDKVSFNPPETSTFKFKGSPLHWDMTLTIPIAFKLQGLLYLNDVSKDGGAFHCVPGFHKELEAWLKKLPPNANPRDEAIAQLKPEPVTGNAGDFIIWHQALPHFASPNRSSIPRFVQYHTYDPNNSIAAAIWK